VEGGRCAARRKRIITEIDRARIQPILEISANASSNTKKLVPTWGKCDLKLLLQDREKDDDLPIDEPTINRAILRTDLLPDVT
jgi:hypothetical protein